MEFPSTTTPEDAFAYCRDMDASLNERLDCYAEMLRHRNPAMAESVDRLVERLQNSEAGQNAPLVGEPMPPFLLPDDKAHLVSLQELLANGPLAVTFHRGHWCPYCRISMNALRKAQRELDSRGTGQIVAVMPDRQKFAQEFKAEAGVAFPILTDMDNGYALSLGLVFWVGDEMHSLMMQAGRDLREYQGNDAWMLPIPATFVVGVDGRIKARFIDPDYRKRMTIEEMLQALAAGAN